jgi:hypothetical protein
MKTLSGSAATAILFFASGTVGAVDLPPMKEGLWSIRNQGVNNPGGKKAENTSTICRSHARP